MLMLNMDSIPFVFYLIVPFFCLTLHENCPNTEFYLVRIFRIRIEYGEIREFFLIRIFPHTLYLSVFNPNTGKYEPEKTPYLESFLLFELVCLR